MMVSTGSHNLITADTGRRFVAAELDRRGANAVTIEGKMPRIEILASNLDQSRTVRIHVKTRRGRIWHTSIERGRRMAKNPGETSFWMFVDLSRDDQSREYYVVPDWWMTNNIWEVFQAYLTKHGGVRPKTPGSKHYAIELKHIRQWKDRWDLLGILSDQNPTT
jgi:hypothetical protein